MTLTAGKKAPAFSLPDQDGNVHTLAEYAGKYLLIYFYPKDDTPGCTVEACSLRDNWVGFSKLKIPVVGVSKDSVKSHKKFAEKYHLPFTLLADEDLKMNEAYGVWGKKKFMGREYMGTFRSSFLVGPDGKIVKVYEQVKPSDHAAEVLKDLTELLKK